MRNDLQLLSKQSEGVWCLAGEIPGRNKHCETTAIFADDANKLDLLSCAKLTPQTPQHTSEHANQTEHLAPGGPISAVAAGEVGPRWVVRAGLLLPDVWIVCF